MQKINNLKTILGNPKTPVILAVLLYLPLTFMGYGIDVDSFRVIEAGKNFLASADYVPSRNPGYVVHEMSSWLLNWLGGSLLANIGTLLLSILAIVSFISICENLNLPNRKPAYYLLIFHPFFWFNSTCTIDYVWALGFFMAGFSLLFSRKYFFAGLAFGLSIGSRLASFIAVGGIILFFLFRDRKSWKHFSITIITTALLGFSFYILPLDFTGWELRLFKASVGSPDYWSTWLRTGRFIYKNIYFWGLPVILFFIFLFFNLIKRSENPVKGGNKWLLIFSLLVITGYEFLFFRFPIAPEYLLASLPFWLFILMIIMKDKKLLMGILLLLVIISNFLSINIAKPDQPSHATDAEYGLWLEKGYLLQSINTRNVVKECLTKDCFVSKMYPE